MLRSVHMDVHTAASIDNSPRMTQGTDNFLQFSHFAVLQFWGIHLHLVVTITDWNLLPPGSMRTMDTGVVNKPPCFSLVIGHFPRIVGAGRTGMDSGGPKQGSHGFCCLLAGESRHLNFTAEALVFQINRWHSPPDGQKPTVCR